MTPVLCAVFFASGCSALILETLWFQQAGLAFGNSIWASSLVLAGFMSGLGLGNALAARYGERFGNPLRAYAIAELTIAVTGVGLVILFPSLGALFAPVARQLLDHPWLLNPLRLLIAFGLLVVPSTAMGITLPLLTKALSAHDRRYGAVLGRLYGWNTLGAMAGVVIAELLLIVTIGLQGTALVAGALNVLIAGVAGWLSMRPSPPAVVAAAFRRPNGVSGRLKPAPTSTQALTGTSGTWLVAAFLSGFALLALEVVWFRLLLLIVPGDSTAFALMLAVVLAGIALGGLAAGVWLRRAALALHAPAACAFAASVACVASYAALPWVMQPFAAQLADAPLDVLRVATPLMLPVSLISGVFFTLAGAGLRTSQRSDTEATGRLTLANTMGAALGSLAGGFLLLPHLGMERSVLLIAVLYGVIGLWLAVTAPIQPIGAPVYIAAGACVVGLLLFPLGAMSSRLLPIPVSRYVSLRSAEDTRAPAVRVAAVREGTSETIQYLEMSVLGQPMFHQLLTNAISMADTEYFSRRYMKLYVYWPLAVHPNPTRALVICYGAGSTAKAMTDSRELKTIDIVDISRDVFDTSRVVYPDAAADPLRDPRVRVHVEDGRYFLQATRQQFDVITAEPPPPTAAGAVNLYTREHFQLIRDRLADGGIAAYWLPMHVLSDAGAKAVLRAFCDVFEDCSLWNGSGAQLMMVGTRRAPGRVTEDQFVRQWRDPRVAVEMKRLGFERPEQLGALFIGDAAFIRTLVGSADPVTDNYPRRINAPLSSQAEGDRLTRSLTDTAAARGRFAASPLIRRLWPEQLIAASLPFFDAQRIITHYTSGGRASIQMTHDILTRTALSTTALWLLGSDWDSQSVLVNASPSQLSQPRLQFHLGVRLIAERSYRAAAGPFSRAEALPDLRARALAFRVYALCMAGELAEAGRVVAEHRDAVRGETWDWIIRTFGLEGAIR